jgi:hypothetical protein
MPTEIPFGIEKRADYTFKYNTSLGRHGWLRLTPAYSVKLVREIIKEDCTKDWAQAGKILSLYNKKLVIVSATGIPSAITYNADDGE